MGADERKEGQLRTCKSLPKIHIVTATVRKCTLRLYALSLVLRKEIMPRVLIVDDEIIVLETLTLILRNAGYDVTPCSSPFEALAALKEHGGDFVITDMQMPHMNGLEVAKSALQLSHSCYVIILSGQILCNEGQPRIEVLSKPIHPQNLLARLQELAVLRGFKSSPMTLPSRQAVFVRREDRIA
jgi:CheY-like chemotaxis protein